MNLHPHSFEKILEICSALEEPDEMKEIRRLLGDEDADQVCPRCGGEIHLRGPVAGGGSIGFVWHAKCPTCDLSSMVVENMARFRDDPLNQEGIQP